MNRVKVMCNGWEDCYIVVGLIPPLGSTISIQFRGDFELTDVHFRVRECYGSIEKYDTDDYDITFIVEEK